MKEQWKMLSARFAALNQREKSLIAGALVVLILFSGYNFWIEPALLRKAAAEKLVVQYNADIINLGAQVAALQVQLKDPDAVNRAAVVDYQKRFVDLGRQLSEYDKVLVPPENMAVLLQALLGHHRGLELVSLKTLTPVPAVAAPSDKTGVKAAEPEKVAVPVTENIYKHGVEIKVSGGYQDVLNYVNEMENSQQHLLLGKIDFVVAKYPRVELTLTVYSLSLDRTWLVI